MIDLSLNHGKKHEVSSVPSVDSKEHSDWAREKSLKCFISHRARRKMYDLHDRFLTLADLYK